MSSAVTCLPGETVIKPGSPWTVTVVRASVRSAPAGYFEMREYVVVLETARIICPESPTVRPASVRTDGAGQPFGTTTDHAKLVWSVSSVSRSMRDGVAVTRPLMSATHSGGGSGSGRSAWAELPHRSIVARANRTRFRVTPSWYPPLRGKSCWALQYESRPDTRGVWGSLRRGSARGGLHWQSAMSLVL